MSLVETIAKIDGKIRPIFASNLPAQFYTAIYSKGKKQFLKSFSEDAPKQKYKTNPEYIQSLWGIKFNLPIMNAAGMFKHGESYYTVANQGAGAYIAGTTTAIARSGNTKNGITHPFASYPNSGTASNWMGLPNQSHKEIAKKLSKLNKIENCPIGASLSSAPEQVGLEALKSLVEGMMDYQNANVDFLELNESCPNVEHHTGENHSDLVLDKGLIERLEYISKHFLKNRKRKLPLIVKLSNDTNPDLLESAIILLNDLGFDGLNLGNTSIQYEKYKNEISQSEQDLYNYFTSAFGGGLSGRILKNNSMELATKAVKITKNLNFKDEFHIIRTGGIESKSDILNSISNGISLCQWYTGYFSNFAQDGHKLYSKMFV